MLGVIDRRTDIHLKYNDWKNIDDLLKCERAQSFILYQGAESNKSLEILEFSPSRGKLEQTITEADLATFGLNNHHKRNEIIAQYNKRKKN